MRCDWGKHFVQHGILCAYNKVYFVGIHFITEGSLSRGAYSLIYFEKGSDRMCTFVY